MKRFVGFAVFILTVVSVFVFWPKQKKVEDADAAALERYVAAEGKVELMPGFEVEVGSELEGKIAEFPVREGDLVNKGDLIARMENGDIRARLKEAEAELAVAKSKLEEVASGARAEEINSSRAALQDCLADLEFAESSLVRFEELYRKGAISKEALDEKEKDMKNAKARVNKASEYVKLLKEGPREETLRLHKDEVKRAEANVEYCNRLLDKSLITSPISGKVIRKYLEAGESATKEKALAAIADTGKTWVNAEVDETDIGLIRVGDTVEVSCDAFPGRLFPGRVEKISDYAGIRKVKPNNQWRNLDMKVVEVKVGLKDESPLKPSMTVDVRIKPRR